MSYARNLLSRGEEVVFESRQHWFAVVAQTWAFIIGAILAFAVLIWSTTSDLGTRRRACSRSSRWSALLARWARSASRSGPGATRSTWSPPGA